ncbi:galectin-3b [Larimichthys crocea]|uniref:galectin-3b n=1 Tax=Larimichthys crocea TaxID=215358 RepID=UPI000F5D5F1F|nr:galectin-5 [Larimichthys crocea]
MMNLEDALGSDQSGGGNVWPGQPSTNPTWPGGQAGGGGVWPGNQAGGAGVWPGGQAGGGGPSAPGGWPSPTVGPGPGPTIPVAAQTNLAIPFGKSLPNGVYDKLLITIGGTIKPNADKITVDIGASRDLAFHFNPRFNEEGKKVIVRNSCINDKWGKEERELQHFPFVRGQPFEMKILCTNREFKVAVNNSHLLTYQHRITNLRSINSIRIYNDLTLSKFNMETLP